MKKNQELFKKRLNFTFEIQTELCMKCESDTPYPYFISPNEFFVRMKCPSCGHVFVRKIFNLKKETPNESEL